jgi:23S rRNA (guanosine2251-2'-O)-methyltransferase
MRKLKNEELGRKTVSEFKASLKAPIIVVLDNVRSMHNIGSIFRTCDAFLVESVFLCGFTATPPNKEIHKTALGAEDSIDWNYFNDIAVAIQLLKEKAYNIISIEQAEGSIMLSDFRFEPDKKYAFVFGNEIKGVSQEVIDSGDACIEIPQFGTKHSFNIVVSAGIVLWEVTRQLSKIKKAVM